MATITIDGKEHNVDNISDKGKEQLASIKFVQNEIQALESRVAVCKTVFHLAPKRPPSIGAQGVVASAPHTRQTEDIPAS